MTKKKTQALLTVRDIKDFIIQSMKLVAPRLYTAKGLAKLLDVNQHTIRQWYERGMPYVFKPGKLHRFYNIYEVKEWLSRNPKYKKHLDLLESRYDELA